MQATKRSPMPRNLEFHHGAGSMAPSLPLALLSTQGLRHYLNRYQGSDRYFGLVASLRRKWSTQLADPAGCVGRFRHSYA